MLALQRGQLWRNRRRAAEIDEEHIWLRRLRIDERAQIIHPRHGRHST
jgi:hypothetical protein